MPERRDGMQTPRKKKRKKKKTVKAASSNYLSPRATTVEVEVEVGPT